MNLTKHTIKRTVLATAVTATLGTAAISEQVYAANLSFNISGWFTMINAAGDGALVNGDASGNEYYGRRTAVIGTMTFDTATNSGTMALQPFSFFGSGDAAATNITFDDIDGPGGAGTLMLGNMGFNWNNNIGIPVSLAWDGDGLLDAIGQGLAVGDTIAATNADFACDSNISCATPATNNFLFNFGKFSYTLPIGASPVATTTFNTTDIGTIELGTNPSGTLPLIADTVGGSPMKAGPFPGFNANFDLDSMTLTSDGSGNINAPDDVDDTVPQVPGPPKQQSVELGVPTGVLPPDSAQYCLTGIADCDANGWTDNLDTGANNPVLVDITQTVNIQTVDWRAGDGLAFATQKVTSTVDDTVPPTIQTVPMDVTVDVTSTNEEVCFSNNTIGRFTATDTWTTNPKIQYSLTGFNFVDSDPVEDCSDEFGPNANTVFWRAIDDAGNIAPADAQGDPAPYQQTVTLNLPGGIVGKACEINLDYDGFRLLAGNFIMFNPQGSQVGSTDDTVTGDINTFPYPDLCTEQGTDICPVVGAALETTQPFEGLLWTAAPVWLYGPGDWTFETCPGDSSTQCDNDPRPLGMTVLDAASNGGVPQLGAHMLFKWGSTENIDVVVVWNVDCGESQLTMTDPATPPNSTYPNGLPPDGILGTPMVDGPFIGFNANFNQSATGVDADGNAVPLIADGGYATSVPAYKNPDKGASPLALDFDELGEADLPDDPKAAESCVGGCYAFETDGMIDATDDNGDYQFVQVVLPLSDVIPFWSLYRKFDGQAWKTFVADDRNSVKLAFKDDDGFCPEPGAGDYKEAPFNSQLADKLEEGTNCVQLTIEDNGPNDNNPAVGIVEDPGGVARAPNPPKLDAKTTDGGAGGGCSVANGSVSASQHGEWWLLGSLLAFLGWRRKQH